jgi:hypothetical protein
MESLRFTVLCVRFFAPFHSLLSNHHRLATISFVTITQIKKAFACSGLILIFPLFTVTFVHMFPYIYTKNYYDNNFKCVTVTTSV